MEEINNQAADLYEEARSETTSGDRLQELAALNDDLAEIAAKNKSASRKMLYKLASHYSKKVKKAVASNPNTPAEKLLDVCFYFPQEALDNPAFQQLEVDDLKYPRHISLNTLSVLIQQNNVPNFALSYAAQSENKALSDLAKMSVFISGEMTEGWHEAAQNIVEEPYFTYHFIENFNGQEETPQYKYRPTQYRVSGNTDAPFESFKLLTNFYGFVPPILLKNHVFKVNTAKNLNTASNVLMQLANDVDNSVRMNVAVNPNTASEILALLANDVDNSVRMNVAVNPNALLEILTLLANDSSDGVRRAVAGNSNTASEILESLVSDLDNQNYEYTQVRECVARNANTSVKVLKLLANDKNGSVRGGLASNPNTPIEILELLANDSSLWVLKELAKNPNTPDKVLQSFSTIQENFLHCTVAQNPNTPIETLKMLANNLENQVRESTSDNPNLPVDILKLLSVDREMRIRFRVARHANTSLEILELLADDDDKQVRKSVARNPNTSLEILNLLANDADYSVRDSVLEHPQCTQEIKETIFKNFAKSEIPSFNRVALFMSEYAESYVLAENSNSISWLERYAIACNSRTPISALEQLASDGNRIVRATAKESLQKRQ